MPADRGSRLVFRDKSLDEIVGCRIWNKFSDSGSQIEQEIRNRNSWRDPIRFKTVVKTESNDATPGLKSVVHRWTKRQLADGCNQRALLIHGNKFLTKHETIGQTIASAEALSLWHTGQYRSIKPYKCAYLSHKGAHEKMLQW